MTPRRVALLLDVIADRRGIPGNVRLLVELAAGLCALGHQVTLVCHDYDPEPGGELERFAREVEIRAVHRGDYVPAAGRAGVIERYGNGMRRAAALVPADAEVVNAHDWPGLRAGSLAAARLGVPLVWTRNDDAPWERAVIPAFTPRGARTARQRLMNGALGALDLRDARRASDVVVLSKFDAGMVSAAYRRPARVIRIGCAERFFDPPDRDAARARLGIDPGTFLVLAFALLVPHRRFEDVIDAIALARNGGAEQVSGLIAGADHHDPAYADRLQQRIAVRGLHDCVELRRRGLSDATLRELYAAADVYVFPSSRQSYGQAPLEALASGTPVIVSSRAGVHEILVGRAGVQIVAPGDPVTLAKAIRVSIEDPLRRRGVTPTREWLRSELSNHRYAQEMSGLLGCANARA